jgi:hypothetical protein
MHFIDGFARLTATCDIGLIRHHQQKKSALPESRQGFVRSRDNPELGRCGRRVGFPVTNNRLVKHAIPVQEHGPAGHLSDR